MFDESLNEAWQRRYGTAAPSEIPDIAAFMRHRSVRRFSSQVVSDSVVEGLIGAAQSAATSSHLQLWSVVTVQDPARRSHLADLCGNQQQIRDAAWFFCFLCDHHRMAQSVDDPGSLDYADYFLMGIVDAALAAERMLCAAESIGLGGCYIGGLRNDPQGVAETLGLPDRVFGVFGMTLGYPASDFSDGIKPRLPQSAVWHREQYQSAGIGDFDSRMSEYYTETGQSTEHTWSQRMGRRLQPKYMGGREVIREWLESRGLNRR